MRVEATPPLFSMSAENRLTAARTPAPSRETSKVAEMTALASSAARAGVGNGGQGETVMKGGGWGVMFFWICSVVDVGGPKLYLGPLYRSRILRSEPGPLHSQSDVFFFKKNGLWSKCGVLRVGRCKGLSMTCAPPTPLPCYSDPPALFRCASFPFRPSHPRCSSRPSPPCHSPTRPDGRLFLPRPIAPA